MRQIKMTQSECNRRTLSQSSGAGARTHDRRFVELERDHFVDVTEIMPGVANIEVM